MSSEAQATMPLESWDTEGLTQFLRACAKGDVRSAEALLSAGCDAAAVTERGSTALMLAAFNGHAALLPWLLEHGAALEARDKDGYTAFLGACADGELGSAKALLSATATRRRWQRMEARP